jgi:hypothetical protein
MLSQSIGVSGREGRWQKSRGSSSILSQRKEDAGGTRVQR